MLFMIGFFFFKGKVLKGKNYAYLKYIYFEKLFYSI